MQTVGWGTAMVISPASSPNSHLRDEDLGDVFAVCSANRGEEEGMEENWEQENMTLLDWTSAGKAFLIFSWQCLSKQSLSVFLADKCVNENLPTIAESFLETVLRSAAF